jgi:hypothetical protein
MSRPRRKVRCNNGNTVERFYDPRTRSSVTAVYDPEHNQIGEAAYDGNQASAAVSMKQAIKDNGGEAHQPLHEMSESDYQLWLKRNKITGLAAAAADRKRRLGR